MAWRGEVNKKTYEEAVEDIWLLLNPQGEFKRRRGAGGLEACRGETGERAPRFRVRQTRLHCRAHHRVKERV